MDPNAILRVNMAPSELAITSTQGGEEIRCALRTKPWLEKSPAIIYSLVI
jgi:hypothetical protein